MPKRKRGPDDGDGDRAQSRRKKEVYERLLQSKKLLHRALKTAKGFERQKLGKRLKNATTSKSPEDVARINAEIEALKRLDLDKMTEAQLYKSLMKVKAIAESDVLPEEVKRDLPKPEGTEEEKKALHNVTSGMWNTKPVQEVMGKAMKDICIALGIPTSAAKSKSRVRKESIKKEANHLIGIPRRIEEEDEEEGNMVENFQEAIDGHQEPLLDGFNSGDEIEDLDGDGGVRIDDQEGSEELDEETLSRYDALIGASSDEESFDESKYDKQSFAPSTRLSISLSPSPSLSEAQSQSHSSSSPPLSDTKAIKPTKTKAAKPPPAKAGGSTFLPTLMGGYWSGSESSASDLEEDAPPTRKNRPGQMARRAIWEKKFGQGANHIKQGHGAVAEKHGKGRDDGWDAKRGAKDSSGDRNRGRRGQRDFRQATGNNAIAVEPRKRAAAKRDDAGTLHPSWQAAKMAKEAKKTATFQGKKIAFD